MNTNYTLADMEKELWAAADCLPGPTKPLPISPVMQERQNMSSQRVPKQTRNTSHPLRRRLSVL